MSRKSVFLRNLFHIKRKFPKFFRFYFCDRAPNKHWQYNDQITLIRNKDIPDGGVCVDTFQESTTYGNGAVEVQYDDDDCDDPKNDSCLDGKVSFIGIYP